MNGDVRTGRWIEMFQHFNRYNASESVSWFHSIDWIVDSMVLVYVVWRKNE
jgi:hypothetical protein